MRDGLGAITGDDDSLARCKAIILDHMRCTETIESSLNLGDGVTHQCHRRGYSGLGHHLLGKCLATFEPGCLSRRSEARNAAIAHGISRAGDQRNLGTDHNQVDVLVDGHISDGLRICHINRQGRHATTDSGITGRNDNVTDRRVLEQSGHERVLAGPASDDEDLHASSLVRHEQRWIACQPT